LNAGQSVIASLDIKISKLKRRYEIFTHNGKKATGLLLKDFAKKMEDYGAGELIINSIDRDGTCIGYDFNLIDEFNQNLNIPFTILGGARDYNDFKKIVERFHPCGIGAGSIFVFKGKHKAVLIQYPTIEEKHRILNI